MNSATPKILLVDDDAKILELYRHCLEELGCELVSTTDSCEALSLLKQDRSFQIVVSDHVMPQLTGLELFGQLKPVREDLHFFMVSASPELSAEWAYSQGLAGFLPKPVTCESLVSAVRSVLRTEPVNRRYERIRTWLDVTIRKLESSEPVQKGLALNISQGGMFVSTELPAPPGTWVELQWTWNDQSFRAKALISWTRPVANHLPRGVGVVFESPIQL